MTEDINSKLEGLCNGMEETCCGLSNRNNGLTHDDIKYLEHAANKVLEIIKDYTPSDD